MWKQGYILYVVAYALDIFAAFPSPRNGFHNSGPVAASIMGDGKVANMSNTYANRHKICPCLRILPILWYYLYVVPGAMLLAESASPQLSPKSAQGKLNASPKHPEEVKGTRCVFTNSWSTTKAAVMLSSICTRRLCRRSSQYFIDWGLHVLMDCSMICHWRLSG